MATLLVTKASNLQCGDKIIHGNKVLLVQNIDGPDYTGTYDVSAKDENSKDNYVIVQDLVTIIM
jgi:hypothetical protein